MAELIWRPARRASAARRPRRPLAGSWSAWRAALLSGWLLTVSVQAACAFVLVSLVIALHQYDRRWGIFAMFALWFLAPGLRRVLGLITGYVENDPLSLAPFVATAAIAALELVQVHMPSQDPAIMLLAAARASRSGSRWG